MVTTDVPGLNLEWLNVDTEQGQTAEPGRSGLTLQQINSTMYGADNLDEVRNRALTVRGSAPDLRSSAHARQYHYKGDVWSDSAMLLYEEANQRQWASATDIPWEKVEPLSDDLEMAMCTLCTFLTQVEFIAGDVPGRFLEQVPTDFFESQLFLGTQVMDEARHQDVFRKRIFVNGGGMSDAGFGAVALLSIDDFTEMTAVLHLFAEGLVQSLFRMGELISQNDAEKRMFRLSAQDESRHLAFGVTHVKYVVENEPWRTEELHHYLDLQERQTTQSQQASLTTNPLTGEALAILAGGGIEKMDEGFKMVMQMRRKQMIEYAHRAKVVGLDRSERMAPELRELLGDVA